jgi:hypothetical protein
MQGIDIALSKLIGCTCFQREVALEMMEKPSIGAIKQGIGRCLSGKALKGCYLASHKCGEDTCGHSFIHTGMQEMMLIGSKFPSIHKKAQSLA